MAIEGVDFSWARPSIQTLKANGKHFVCRYIGNFGGKSATKSELANYRRNGIDVVLNYEADGRELLNGYNFGVALGKKVNGYTSALGFPGAVVYFSVDFEAASWQYATIAATLDGIASVIGRGRVGVYGGYYLIKYLADHGRATFFWQTYAWSYGHLDPRAHLYQWWNNRKINGSAVDFTRALKTNYGQVGYVVAPAGEQTPTPHPAQPVGKVTVNRSVAAIQRLVGLTGAGIDGIYGPKTTAAVKVWQEGHGLTADGIWGPKSDAKGFPPKPTVKPVVAPVFPLKKGQYFGPRFPLSNRNSISGYFTHRADLKRWQAQAARKGYYKGKVDGLYGAHTAAAAIALQKRKGLKQDRLIGINTWKAVWA